MRGKLSLVIVSIALLSGCSTVDQQADQTATEKTELEWPIYIRCSDNNQYKDVVCPAGLSPVPVSCSDGQLYEGSCPKFFVECNDCTPSSALSIKVEMDECESSGGVWYDIYDDIDDSTYDTCIRE